MGAALWRAVAVSLGVAVTSVGCQERVPQIEFHGAPSRAPMVRAEPRTNSVKPASPIGYDRRARARHALGVPLHAEPAASEVSGRLPDATRVVVDEQSADGRWLRVRTSEGASGWISRRYLDGASAPTRTDSRSLQPAPVSPFSSPESCARLLRQGSKVERKAGRVRIGSWNVRWFPDGKPGNRAQPVGTDIPWLACVISWLGVDVLVVQEFKTHARALAKVAELVALIDRDTGGRWHAEFDDCPNLAGQHVGLLVNTARVSARAFHTFSLLNPHASACKDQLRPGFGAYLSFAGGLDLHVIGVHLKSGTERRSYELRGKSLLGIARTIAEANGNVPDKDLLLVGDFNTMGCAHCSPSVAGKAEMSELSVALLALREPFKRVEAALPCSHFFGGRASLLDHFVASRDMSELPGGRRTEVFGHCADRECRPLWPGERLGPGAERLSDHCPIVLELDDTDLD